MDFVKYQHVERLGTDKVNGILNGIVHVFPKIDGTNTSLWMDNGELCVGNRRNKLNYELDNYHSYEILRRIDKYTKFFQEFPNLRLYGEFLVPIHIKSYQKDAWRKFYVFDVMDGDRYLTYDEYKPMLEKFAIEYIPCMGVYENPTQDEICNLCDKGMFLQVEGGRPEGIVVKNYGYKNYAGEQILAKVISAEFKRKTPIDTISGSVEEKIVFKYITPSFIEKEYSKFVNEVGGWDVKYIQRLFNSIWHVLIEEEMWNIIKRLKNPTIDFRKLYSMMCDEIKKVKPELFK